MAAKNLELKICKIEIFLCVSYFAYPRLLSIAVHDLETFKLVPQLFCITGWLFSKAYYNVFFLVEKLLITGFILETVVEVVVAVAVQVKQQ